MVKAVASILAVAGLAFIAIGVYKGAPAIKQHTIRSNAALVVFVPFGLAYWIWGMVFLALELSN